MKGKKEHKLLERKGIAGDTLKYIKDTGWKERCCRGRGLWEQKMKWVSRSELRAQERKEGPPIFMNTGVNISTIFLTRRHGHAGPC